MKTGEPVGLNVSSGKYPPSMQYSSYRVQCNYNYAILLFLTGEALLPIEEGIFDNYRVKKTLLHSW